MRQVLASIVLLALAFTAACGPAVEGPRRGGGFRPACSDGTAGTELPPDDPRRKPAREQLASQELTKEEVEACAALMDKLANAASEDQRVDALNALIALGPRYLEMIRQVSRPEIELDLLFVISRIEDQAGIESPPERKPEPARPEVIRRAAGGSENLPEAPSYPDEENTDYDRKQVEAFLGQRLTQARRLLALGDHRGAEEVAKAALILLPDTRYKPDFEELVLAARGQGQQSALIAGVLNLDPEFIQFKDAERGAEFAEPLNLRCFLKNVSRQTLNLVLSDGEGRESVVELSVRYEQVDYQGNVMASEGRVLLPVTTRGVIRLAPNDSYEIALQLAGLGSLDPDGSRKYALGVVTAKAALRVYGAADENGEPLGLRPVAFPSRTVKVFPSSFRLAETKLRPLTALGEAISLNQAQNVFLAAQLVQAKDLRAAGDLLLGEDLETCALTLQRARMRAMQMLTGAGATFDARRWRSWWLENRLRY